MSVRRLAVQTSAAVLTALAVAASSGCAAVPLLSAAVAAAPVLTGRSAERTVAADMADTWAAVERALPELGFRIERRERTEDGWHLHGTAEEVLVTASVERVTARLTRLTLRVDSGGVLSDRKTGDVIQDRIVKLVDAASRRADRQDAEANTDGALRALEAEVRRLRGELQDRRSVVAPPEPIVEAPKLRVNRGAVITVPPSAVLPSVGGAAPALSVAPPVAAVAPVTADVEPATPPDASAPSAAGPIVPLRPADVLVPVRPTRGSGSGT